MSWATSLLDRFRPKPAELSGSRLEQAYTSAIDEWAGWSPRIAIVKQDINEDLYCCGPNASPREIVESTLLRTGPFTLFTDFQTDFHIVETVDDPECRVWQERATHLQWDTIEFFRSYQDAIPGRDYGQRRFAVPVDSIDWSQYDVVVSIDVSIPARITREYPETVWSYYVREIKTPSYADSLVAPIDGYDLFLTHNFRPVPPRQPKHCLEFPYHLQSVGSLAELFDRAVTPDADRSGVFVDHHTMAALDEPSRECLNAFGPVTSTLHGGVREVIPTSERLAIRTVDVDRRERLLDAKYFLVTAGKRRVFGTSIVEAIAAGTLAIGTPDNVGCPFLFSKATSASNADEAVERMQAFEADSTLYARELERQRSLVNYLCWARPLRDLKRACETKISGRPRKTTSQNKFAVKGSLS